jgi:hypothetical protein
MCDHKLPEMFALVRRQDVHDVSGLQIGSPEGRLGRLSRNVVNYLRTYLRCVRSQKSEDLDVLRVAVLISLVFYFFA